MKRKREKYSINRAKSIINDEGIAYAVMHYCYGSDFKDKKLSKLWDNADKALKQLEEYIENNSTDADD